MAIYHFKIKHISRSQGRSATAAAAYRAGINITDERTGEIHHYQNRKGVLDHTILAPSRAPAWAHEAQSLWNAQEKIETRKDSRVARENIVALPHELSLEQNKSWLHQFVQDAYVKRGMAAQVDIHGADMEGDQRNIHAHILLTTRQLTRNGFKEQKPERWNKKETLKEWRELFAQHQNQALERAGFAERVDSRTLQEQGIFREATKHLGAAATALERKGEQTRAAAENRQIKHWNRELAETQYQLALHDAAIAQAEQDLAKKQAAKRTEQTRQQEAANSEERKRQRRERQGVDNDTWHGQQREAGFLRKLDLEREFEAEKLRELEIKKAELAQAQKPEQARAALKQAQADVARHDHLFGRVSGHYQAALDAQKNAQLTLNTAEARIAEGIKALEQQQQQERQAFYGHDERTPVPRPDLLARYAPQRAQQQPQRATPEPVQEMKPKRVHEDFHRAATPPQAQVPPQSTRRPRQQEQERDEGFDMSR